MIYADHLVHLTWKGADAQLLCCFENSIAVQERTIIKPPNTTGPTLEGTALILSNILF